MPRIAGVEVVERNRCLILRRSQRRVERQVVAGPGICTLRVGNDAQHGIDDPGVCGAARRDARGSETGKADQTAAARIAELVCCGEVDAAAVIGALVEVEVVLILTAKLDQVASPSAS